jgi:hypothetical protein
MATCKQVWRIYCNRQEFGIDYPSLKAAQRVARVYRQDFPHLRYYVRATTRPRVSQLVSVPV